MRFFENKKTTGLLLLALLALALRVGVVAVLWQSPAEPFGYEHDEIARNLLDGKGFAVELLGHSGPTSQQAPFYPLLLAGVYAVFGAGTAASLLAVQLLQCLAGTAIVLVVARLGWSLVPQSRSVGWLAGLGAAVYPTHLYMVTHLQVALWAALLLTLLLGVAVSPRWQSTRGGAILLGVLAGMLLLVEPILVLAVPVAAAAFWSAEAKRFAPAALGRVAVIAGVCVLLIAPWLLRNRLVHGEFVFIKSTFGYAFWQANNPISHGTDKVPKASAQAIRLAHDGTPADMNRALWEAHSEAVYIDNLLLGPEDYKRLGILSEPQRCRRLGQRGWSFIRANPGRYAELCLQRLRYFLLFDETNPKAANRLYRAAAVTWLALAFVGLLVSGRCWRKMWPTYAIFSLVTAFHALVITAVRFRIPLEPMTFVWAALALNPALQRLFARPQIKIHRPGQLGRDPLNPDRVLQGPHFLPSGEADINKQTRRRVG